MLFQQTWPLFLVVGNYTVGKLRFHLYFNVKIIISQRESTLEEKWQKQARVQENKPDEKNYKLQDRAKICDFYNPDNRNKHEKTAIKVFWLNRE